MPRRGWITGRVRSAPILTVQRLADDPAGDMVSGLAWPVEADIDAVMIQPVVAGGARPHSNGATGLACGFGRDR